MTNAARKRPISSPIKEARLFTPTERPLCKVSGANPSSLYQEELEWKQYVATLDPNDEHGAFLLPGDVVAVNEAYRRLQSTNRYRQHEENEDMFIKNKMATAMRRAFMMINDLQSSLTPSALYVVTKIEDDGTQVALTMAAPYAVALKLFAHFRKIGIAPLQLYKGKLSYRPNINVIKLVRGLASGEINVALPTGQWKTITCENEPAFKIGYQLKAEKFKYDHTTYLLGVCMNVLKDLDNKWMLPQVDGKGIKFTPASIGEQCSRAYQLGWGPK